MGIYVSNKFAGKPAFHPIAYHTASEVSSATPASGLKKLLEAIVEKYRQHKTHRENRAAFQHMLSLDDNLLKDIGVSRADVIWANQLPLSQNAATELEIIARRKSSRL